MKALQHNLKSKRNLIVASVCLGSLAIAFLLQTRIDDAVWIESDSLALDSTKSPACIRSATRDFAELDMTSEVLDENLHMISYGILHPERSSKRTAIIWYSPKERTYIEVVQTGSAASKTDRAENRKLLKRLSDKVHWYCS